MKTAPRTAAKLLKWIARVGIPKEILTDQGKYFMAGVMKGIYEVLQLKHLRTLVYYLQTNGLLEHFNCTLKVMLNKCIQGDPKRWDQLLMPLMFSIKLLWAILLSS